MLAQSNNNHVNTFTNPATPIITRKQLEGCSQKHFMCPILRQLFLHFSEKAIYQNECFDIIIIADTCRNLAKYLRIRHRTFKESDVTNPIVTGAITFQTSVRNFQLTFGRSFLMSSNM